MDVFGTSDELDCAGVSDDQTVRSDAMCFLDEHVHLHRRAISSFLLSMMASKLKSAAATPGGAAAIGGVASGSLMYIHCKAKCPGGAGTGNGLFGALGGMGKQAIQEVWSPVSGLFTGAKLVSTKAFSRGKGSDSGLSDSGDKHYGVDKNGQWIPPEKLLRNHHKRVCEANCKLDAMTAGAVGAAAGHMVGSRLHRRNGKPPQVQNFVATLVPSGAEGPLDEWTTAPFFAAMLSNDRCNVSTDTRSEEGSRDRDGMRDLNHECFREFLGLADGANSPVALMCDRQCDLLLSPHGDGHEHRKSSLEKRTSETSASWKYYFQ